MKSEHWDAVSAFVMGLKSYCETLTLLYHEILAPLQKDAASCDTPDYPIENAVVYNTAWDELRPESEIRLIVIGDNPGKKEQLNAHQKYLVGQSGKVAEHFFAAHPELEIDFRKHVMILNKTPIHSAKTDHLRKMAKASPIAEELIRASQIVMARMTANLHQALGCPIWMVGYGGLKSGGIFEPYKETLMACYKERTDAWKNIYVFQHFSMNCFANDLKKFTEAHPEMELQEALKALGTQHCEEFFTLPV